MPTASSDMANFTPVDQDYSVTHMLANVFGEVTGNIFGTGPGAGHFSGVLGTAFAYFNSAVLFFGTIILAYVTVFGIMNTANDGQALGRRWSTLMTPVRIAASAASLIPTTSGYSIIQLIVLQVAVWGVGIADTTWSKVVEASLTKTLPSAFVSFEGDQNTVRKLASDVLYAKVCSVSLTEILGNVTDGKTKIGPVQKTLKTSSGKYETTRQIWEFKDTADQPAGGGAPVCGTVEFASKDRKPTSGAVGAVVSATTSMLRDESMFGQDFTEKIANEMATNISINAYNALDQKLNVLAGQIVGDGQVDAHLFQEAIIEYMAALKNGYDSTVNGLTHQTDDSAVKQFLEVSTSRGWVQAGMFHRRLSQIQTALKDAYKVVPTSKPPMQDLIQDMAPKLDKALLGKYALAMERASNAIRDGGKEFKAKSSADDAAGMGFPSLDVTGSESNPQNIWDGWIDGMGKKIVASIIDVATVPDGSGWVDPVLQVKEIGDWSMLGAESIILTQANSKILIRWTKAGASALGMVPGVGLAKKVSGADQLINDLADAALNTIDELFGIIKPSVYGLLYVGYFMSIFLPMVPFMIFTLAVIGWLIAVVESVVAAPLWMVMHMTPESNDSFIGSQQQGYLLLLSVFFKPILTVLGLLLSMLILRPAMDLVNMGFIGSMVTIQANSTTGIPSIFGFVVVYAFITFSVFMTVFALPQDMSDRVLKWISAGIGSLGEKEAMSKIEGGASSMSREGLRSAGANASRRHASALASEDKAHEGKLNQKLLASNERIIAALEGRSSKGDQPVNSGSGS